ncbi:cupin domain-containing protein [Amycolatopsis sp.]|uniref:cupin domain-containing protein n=1 Tax=Amycolatopsis sp. TaxID=37632 RepID=UPI002CD46022|nr:cupin domain-containing protein [Amycolatopsis sp.]HVV13686.1 cupin domain-containing protein [Amycolatopsis sp.]
MTGTDHHAVVSLSVLATELLEEARAHHSRRTARTIVSGTSMRATVIALAEGAQLAEHDAPAAATVHVLSGRVRLHTDEREWLLDAGEVVPVPPQRHGLDALTDCAVLLTVALR